ncbi:MAG: ABC transporter ATP-binding protein [Comamonas sp.]|uniref:ABC transporter ATP-binding protein n=1 Tax=Comamonas sp. TaxID=34028 RepID=UPI002FCC5A0A
MSSSDTHPLPVLRVRDLGVTFDTYRGPVQVLRDVNFEIAAGEILGVVGESGAGKSMTGAAVIGLIDPPGRISSGSVELDGERIDGLRGEAMRRIRGRRIGSIFQDPLTSLNPVYTVGRHLVETIRTHLPLTEAQARARALELLEEVEIPEARVRLGQYPHQFSGGMRQRVAIALALCAEPQLIIADEPTTALDVSVQAQIIALLRRVCRERQAAAMLITHDMGVIAETADRVMVMYQGRVLETGPVREVLDRPTQPYTRVLMAAIPSVHQRLERLPVPEIGAPATAAPVRAEPVPHAAAAEGKALLEVRDLGKEFDLSLGWLERLVSQQPRRMLQAVDGVSFKIRQGSTFGLVGESGSGKSTVARMVAGLTVPTRGQVLFDGQDRFRTQTDLRRRIQMIFQDPYASLNPRWTVARLIAEPLEVLGLSSDPNETAERVAQALRRVRMTPDDARKYPHQFSGGQRQRIAIARALASQPEFIICDEPTSALDVSVQAQVLNLMRDLQDEFGLTYLLISHNLAVIRHMCDDIGVMQRGRLVEAGDAQEVLDAPQHEYTRALMAAVPDIQHAH